MVHRDAVGRTVKVPAAQAAGVPLTRRDAVWAPSRHPSQRSIATWWWSATTGRLVSCRSLQRLTVAMLPDFHPQVVDFQAWSARLEWRERGRERSLVPDFFVRTASGALVVVACPPATGPSARRAAWSAQAPACDETPRGVLQCGRSRAGLVRGLLR